MKKPIKDKVNQKYKRLKKPLKWLDCVSQTGWLSLKQMEAAKPATCTTGEFWIYKETDAFITLFGTYSEDENGEIEPLECSMIALNWITIPCIKKIIGKLTITNKGHNNGKFDK